MRPEDTLSSVLSEFARTMVTDFPIQAILDRLVERIVDVLDISAAGVTLIAPGVAPHYIAASDPDALRFERLQTDLGEGPCLLAYETGKAVEVPDLTHEGRFPRFAPAALSAGLSAVFTFPLWHGEERLGALDLYRDEVGPLDAGDMSAAKTLADVTAAFLLNAQAREDAREMSERFRHTSLHDPLTGLPNRVLLQQRLEHLAQRSRRSHSVAAVLFADLDHFKAVNDEHGHRIGDLLLVAVAQRLAALVRPGDTLARMSGDEFVVLCEDLNSAEDVGALAERIEVAFRAPFVIEGVLLQITASVGMAYAGPGEDISHELVVSADLAMYEAKREGRDGQRVIDLRDTRRVADRERLRRDLRLAVSTERLDLAYQPIVRTYDGVVTGVEALVRWAHPGRDAVSIPTMIDIAERNGMIASVGAWVLQRACNERRRWLQDYPDVPMDLAVNVSPAQLMGPGFWATVASALESTGMEPSALTLEMTEGIFLDDTARLATVLSDLKDLGVRLALDDFGTGYSSLTYLRRFPVDIVKIDQSFIASIGRDASAGALVAGITNLAHILGLTVTAEGVETEEQRREVLAVGCEHAQGFLYARPMPGLALAAQLRDRQGPTLRLPAFPDR